MEFWENNKATCYSIPFIHIQGIFLIHGEILKYVYQFYFFRAIMMCTVSEN